MRASRVLLAVGLGALVLAAAGCGGGGGGSSATTTTEPPIQGTSSTTTTTSASGVSGLASASNCRQLAELSGKLGQIFGGTPSGNSKQYAAFLHAFADRAPKEIRPDFQTLANAYGKLADALGNYNASSGQQPSPAQLLKLMKAVQDMDQQKLDRAGLNISAWAKKNCTHP